MANWTKPSARDPWKVRVATGETRPVASRVEFGHCGLGGSPSFKFARFHEILVQEFGPTNGTPKKEPQRSGLTTESCSDGQRLPAPLGRRSRRLDHRMLWDIEAAAHHTLSHALCEELPSQIGPRAD